MEVQERKNGNKQRRVLTGMIVDRAALQRIAPRWDGELFGTKWCNLIGSWCVGFHEKYDKAPGREIESLFEKWSAKTKDKDTVKLIEKFLSQLSGEYSRLKKETNTQYVVDLAEDYFTEQRLLKLADDIRDDVEAGEKERALLRVQSTDKVDVGVSSGIDVLSDLGTMEQAFASKSEPLIFWPGDKLLALNNFFADAFERDSFVAILAPEKRGKSWWLQEIGWQAMLQDRRVAIFSVGDLSLFQAMRRLGIRAAGRPLKPTQKDRPLKIPTGIEHNPEERYAVVEHEVREYKSGLDGKIAYAACQDIIKKYKQKQPYLKLSVHPNSSISVKGIENILRDWERGGWHADIIIVDYADILAPMNGSDDSREQINKTWKALRALSQRWHASVVTATQSDADSYNSDLLDRSNFSEDKRKYAHCTAMFGLNQTDEEKENGLFRLNWLVMRENDFVTTKCVHVAGCIGLARPAIWSTF